MAGKKIGEDLALIGTWLTLMADFMLAIGATVLTEPDPLEENTKDQQMMAIENDLRIQKKQLQKQQIQMQLWQLQQELKELEDRLKKTRGT